MGKRLSLDETKTLLRGWRELKDEDALELLIKSNMALVTFFVRKYLGRGLTFEELESAGKYGLFNAILKFDYENHEIEKFSSYIAVCIENSMRYEIKRYNKHSHVMSLQEPIGQNKDGDEMTVEDIVGTDAEELLENVISDMKIDIVRDALKCLTSREQQIILLRYGLDDAHRKTLEEIAEIFHCSKTLIQHQETKALIKMRHPRNTRKLKDFMDE